MEQKVNGSDALRVIGAAIELGQKSGIYTLQEATNLLVSLNYMATLVSKESKEAADKDTAEALKKADIGLVSAPEESALTLVYPKGARDFEKSSN